MKARNLFYVKAVSLVAILTFTIIGLFMARPAEDWTAQQLQQAIAISNLENAKSAAKADEREFVKADMRDIIQRVKMATVGNNFQRSYKDAPETILKVINDYNDFKAFLTGLRKLAPGEKDLTKLPDKVYQEIGVSKVDVNNTLMNLGIDVAKSFIIFGNYYRIAGGAKGEWTPLCDFQDIAQMMDFIRTVVFDETGIEPGYVKYFDKRGKQIVVSGELIRQIASADLRERIAKVRQELDDRFLVEQLKAHITLLKLAEEKGFEGLRQICRKTNLYPEKQREAFGLIQQEATKIKNREVAEAFRRVKTIHKARLDALAPLLALGKRGIDDWHFDQKALGLSKDEWKMLIPQNKKGQMHV